MTLFYCAFRMLAFLAVAVLTPGCVTARKVTSATDERLYLQTTSPQQYRVRVLTPSVTNDFAVAESGRTTIHVPAMGPGCSSHLFGLVQVYDESPFAWRVVQVMRGETVLREFSLKQLARLPQDADGYRTVRVE